MLCIFFYVRNFGTIYVTIICLLECNYTCQECKGASLQKLCSSDYKTALLNGSHLSIVYMYTLFLDGVICKNVGYIHLQQSDFQALTRNLHRQNVGSVSGLRLRIHVIHVSNTRSQKAGRHIFLRNSFFLNDLNSQMLDM